MQPTFGKDVTEINQRCNNNQALMQQKSRKDATVKQ